MPGWWLEAFEHAATGHGEPPCSAVREGLMLHGMDAQELALLALILGDVQRQAFSLEGPKSQIEIHWQSLHKRLPVHDAASRLRLLSVLNALPTLRFCGTTSGSEVLRVSYLFSSESWSAPVQSGSDFNLKLQLSSHGYELLCGYVDAHLDFLRDLDGQSRLISCNFGRLPLVLWTPIWLELGLTEQVLYARMEQIMQNQGAWIRLDGLVGASLEQLTMGLKFAKRNTDSGSLILDRLRLVVKLGRRLMAHGLLQKEPSNDYMALSDHGRRSAPMLLWQASAERLRSQTEMEYFGLAAAQIFRGPVCEAAPRIIQCFAQLSTDPSLDKRLQIIWSLIASSPGCAINLAPGLIIQSHVLFLEWIARAVPGARIPLSSHLSGHVLVENLRLVNEENAVRLFSEFTRVLRCSPELERIITDSGQENPFSLATASLPQDLRVALSQQRISQRPEVVYKDQNSLDRDATGENLVGTSLNRIAVNSNMKIREKIDQGAQKLRKMAQYELEMMVKQAPHDYAKLKQSFLSSLDHDKRTLVLDVQRRLDSKEFERQLKPRIVRFMVEHPGAWKSVSNTLLL